MNTRTSFRSDIKEILSAIDLLVISSLLEGLPMITLESMPMAKPIVATNIDGITEQITNGVNGILVLPKDPSALANAVIRVLNEKELAIYKESLDSYDKIVAYYRNDYFGRYSADQMG
jgi:glycosyltransferase involved in cell wall biosynthesis